MQNMFIVPIEPIETRYTKHWYRYLEGNIQKRVGGKYAVKQLDVDTPDTENTPGAFLNFSKTIEYKSNQMQLISRMFSDGVVKSGDVFLFTDYWNPLSGSLRYMATLLGIDVKIIGICHAGFWDPYDILSQSIPDNPQWARDIEQSLDSIYDFKLFATNFAKELYMKKYPDSTGCVVTGFPMDYYDEIMPTYWGRYSKPEKEDIITFPHRKSKEKNLDLFLALKEELPQYRFVVAMDETKDKSEYHDLLYRSKLCFSASLQETLGISIGIESLRAGCDVLVPDRLSYHEMFESRFKYPGSIANTYNHTKYDVDFLKKEIERKMESFSDLTIEHVKSQHDFSYSKFFSGSDFYNFLETL